MIAFTRLGKSIFGQVVAGGLALVIVIVIEVALVVLVQKLSTKAQFG